MKNDDPILAARSVRALMQALNDVYGWTLPLAFPAGTPLAALWAIAITVRKDPATGVLYVATSTETYPVAAILDAIVGAQVLTGRASTPPAAFMTHRSASTRRKKHEQVDVVQSPRRGRR
ncbi:hypothetical protein [Burkholderia ubonensis]|uniref:hypothetical protein n=1 Tax=Burkholderia ubonensis TaxID=101571 RepID=UPI00075A04EB|nr:hypothetical protein [Burkholderia ubonensis]KVT45255.1 hypothetical protein WK51_03630 [Burkholderia ubonensis]